MDGYQQSTRLMVPTSLSHGPPVLDTTWQSFVERLLRGSFRWFVSFDDHTSLFFFLLNQSKKKNAGVVRIESGPDTCEYRYYILRSVNCSLNCTCIDCTRVHTVLNIRSS